MDKKDLFVFFITLLFCFIVLEISVRSLGVYDEDGQFSFKGYSFKPYTLPYNSLTRLREEFLNSTENSFYSPHKYLGWSITPNVENRNKLYNSNSAGLRGDKEFEISKLSEIKRIGVFGDSYIFASDVYYNETWNYFLDQKFKEQPFEVLNFGVGGYGIDQAYLNWNLTGKKYDLDYVLIGFQAENCRRNLYIIRKLYSRESELPFFKPRFILENNSLKLVNYPVADYLSLPEIVKNFENEELLKYEYFYNKKDYEKKFYHYSKALMIFSVFFKDVLGYEKKHREYYKANSPEMKLCYEVIKKFVNEAEENSKVFIVHIPKREDIEQKLRGNYYFYEDFLNNLKGEFQVIDIGDEFMQTAKNNSLDYLYMGHFTKEGNKILAEFIYKEILKELENEQTTGI